MRIAALQLMAAVVGGLGGGDRNSASVQAETLKAVSRVAKYGANSEARLALAGARHITTTSHHVCPIYLCWVFEHASRHVFTCLCWHESQAAVNC